MKRITIIMMENQRETDRIIELAIADDNEIGDFEIPVDLL